MNTKELRTEIKGIEISESLADKIVIGTSLFFVFGALLLLTWHWHDYLTFTIGCAAAMRSIYYLAFNK